MLEIRDGIAATTHTRAHTYMTVDLRRSPKSRSRCFWRGCRRWKIPRQPFLWRMCACQWLIAFLERILWDDEKEENIPTLVVMKQQRQLMLLENAFVWYSRFFLKKKQNGYRYTWQSYTSWLKKKLLPGGAWLIDGKYYYIINLNYCHTILIFVKFFKNSARPQIYILLKKHSFTYIS